MAGLAIPAAASVAPLPSNRRRVTPARPRRSGRPPRFRSVIAVPFPAAQSATAIVADHEHANDRLAHHSGDGKPRLTRRQRSPYTFVSRVPLRGGLVLAA